VLWERIVEGAHENGEPGVIYLDRVNAEHSFPVESTPTGDGSKYEILATNPCVAEGTLVNTPDGYRRVEDIDLGDEISTVIGSEAVDEIETHDDYPVYRVEFSDGGSLDVTAQHRFHVLRDDKQVEEIPLHDVEEGDHVRLHPSELDETGTDEQYKRELKRGILLGDGCYTDAAVDRNHVHISTSVEDEGYNERVKELFGEEHFRSDDPHSEGKAKKMVLSDGGAVVQQLDLDPAKAPGKSFDPTELTAETEVMGVLDGLLASDGNINLYSNHPQIRWDTSSEDLADAIRHALLSVGIHGRISVIEDPKRGGSINGRKVSANNPKYTVNVSGASARRYAEKSRIEKIHPEKGEQMFELRTEWMTTGNTWKAQVDSIEKLDETTTVYDLYCSESDTWITEGYVQQGCGEQPLMEYEACNLGHINLSTVADLDAPDWRVWSDRHRDEYDSLEAAVDAFLADAIDREEFDHRIEWGTRFLENVVTMSNFPVEKIEETVRNNRKVGLGIMGLAQLYIQLGVAYGSEVANEIARQLMVDINHGSKWTSHELAGDRDSFANWADSKYANPTEYADWFERMTGLDAEEWGEGFPIRNHNTTTIAPTGCVEENSLVSTDEGLVPIKDLDETTAEFEQWNEIEVGVSTDGGTKAATAVYDNGFADVRRIETEGGFSVASTPDHRFRTITDDGEYVWQEAAEFESGDRILLQRGTFDSGSRATLDTSERRNYHWNSDEQLELPSEMTPELAEFLGYFMGDGYVHEDVGVKLVVESDAQGLDAYLRKLGESVFGVSPTVEDRDTRHVLVFGGRHLPRYFEDNGWKKADGNEGEGAASAFVPDEVLQGNEAVAKAFLRGLFEADGTASRKVELSTVSETLADQVQTLLLALGCVFVRDTLETADRNDHYGDRPRHSVRGANKREDQRFLEEVGFITKSTEFDLTPQSHKNDTYPPAVVDSLRDVSGYDSVSEPVKNRVNQSPINGSVSRKLVRDIEEETGETVRIDGRPLVDFYAATVGSVTEETAYTKDISVPSNNTYVANGFVTHNTTSMVGNTSGGCEPIYNVAYYKNVSDDVQGDEMLVEFDDYFLRVLEDNDIPIEAVKEEAKEQMATNSFDGVDGLTTVPDAIGELFVTTSDLSAKGHASVQCACQVGVDSAISKTTNAPNDSTVEDAAEVFEYIYENGGKGVTYYRDGTRSKQVLTTRAQNTEFSDMDEDEATEALLERVEDVFGGMEEFLAREDVRGAIEADVAEIFDIDVDAGVDYSEKRPRPDVLHGVTQRIETGYGKLYVNINEDERGQPFELFATIGNSGGFTNSFTEALAKTVSTALRSGVDPGEIADELQGIRSPKVAWDKGEQIQSIPDAVGTAMRRYLDGDIDPAYPQQRTLEETAEDDGASETVEEREARANLEEAEVNAEPDGGVQAAPGGTASEDASQSLIDAGESPECPECGSMSLHFSEGCKTCEACGWSEC
jgi:ribonucleoside-diphosphate reductase alpha chain